ncbi:MAG: DM13 domain-containing protein [Pseudomonadota bacterium]
MKLATATAANTVRAFGPGTASMLALGLMLGVTGTSAMNEAVASQTERSGQFSGDNNHVTTGKVTVKQVDGRTVVVLGPKFSLDGAPAPTIGFSTNGKFDAKSEFTKLESLTGSQTYTVPATLDVSGYDAIHIWCADFNVSLGTASLN